MHLARRLRKKGSRQRRRRTDVVQGLGFCSLLLQRTQEVRARAKMQLFLYDTMKLDQFRLRMSLYHNRIQNIQRSYRRTLAALARYKDQLTKFIDDGVVALRAALIGHKNLQKRHKDLLN